MIFSYLIKLILVIKEKIFNAVNIQDGLDEFMAETSIRKNNELSGPEPLLVYTTVRSADGKIHNVRNLKKCRFDSQNNNDIAPTKTCYPTSIAMFFRTAEQLVFGGLGRRKYLREDSEDILIRHIKDNRAKYQEVVWRLTKATWSRKISPRYVGGFWVWFINKFVPGYKAKYRTMTFAQAKRFIVKYKLPLVASTKLTRGGHIILITGFNEHGFVAHDPFGDARNYRKYKSSTKTKKTDYGKSTFYTHKMIKKSHLGCVVITRAEL